jgi:gamma-glutamyltranspeptidase / glutathione hydrolase
MRQSRAARRSPSVDRAIAEALEQRGHSVEIDLEIDVFGCGQIIWRLPSGVYVAGSDGRTDGCALGY